MARAEQAVKMETGRVQGPGGVEFFWRQWSGPKTGRRAILLVHGLGEHCGRYGSFGEYFASRGVPVLSFDLRGHGQSGGARGHLDEFDDYVGDVLFFRERLASRFPGEKPALVGHSLGGLIALATVQARGDAFSAIVASAPLLGIAVKVPGWKAALGKFLAGVLPRFSMTNEINPAFLSRNPEVGRKYAADPDVGNKVSAGWFVQNLEGMARVNANAAKVAIPAFILQGTEDRLVSVEATRAFFASLGDIPKAYKEFEGFYHELFQEDERDQVFGFIWDWLVQRGLVAA